MMGGHYYGSLLVQVLQDVSEDEARAIWQALDQFVATTQEANGGTDEEPTEKALSELEAAESVLGRLNAAVASLVEADAAQTARFNKLRGQKIGECPHGYAYSTATHEGYCPICDDIEHDSGLFGQD